MSDHAHVWIVVGKNAELGAFAFLKAEKAGRRYFWRVSECQLADCPSASAGGALYTEGAFAPFPASPAIGEPLKVAELERPVQEALL